MIKQGLIISIDYTDTYCQVCYYSMRHNRPESVTTGTEVMRYLIPTALTYDMENGAWLIGNAALENVQLSGAELYQHFISNCMEDKKIELGDSTLSYSELFAIYLGKMVEMAKTATAVQGIYNVTVNLRSVTDDAKQVFTEALEMIGVSKEKIKFLSSAESFAYYILTEDTRLWQNGSLLFDFSEDGFYIRLLKTGNRKGRDLVFVEEMDCNDDFSVGSLASEILRGQLDEKLNEIFEDIYGANPVSSVFFAGSGFNELWFEKTLGKISEKIRAFRGNNLYVKGACQSGYRRMSELKDYPILCRERTKVCIHIDAKDGSDAKPYIISDGCKSWHDASSSVDLILDKTAWITLKITSVLSDKTAVIEFDLEDFPKRPNKATRIELKVNYLNEEECEISIKDKGFGEFFEASGKEVVKKIRIEEYL